jgi:hypothetical protein
MNMDTDNSPIFADYRYNVVDGEVSHFITSTEGSYTVEFMRKILNAYRALDDTSRDRVDALIRHANRTGTPISEGKAASSE